MSKQPKRFAILDIETTGGNSAFHAITDIAIRIFDGEKVVNSFDSLINPNKPIPPFIVNLTGITNEMVANAPTFEEVANQIDEITQNCIIVAHNINFDYGFIKNEFRKLGKSFVRKKLCTVRLSRQILPNLYSYSLGKIAQQLGFKIEGRHRAAGDTEFTVKLFEILLQKDTENFIEVALNQRSRESLIPPNLEKEKFDLLPESLGLYFFKDRKGKIIYIGKAKNIKSRVTDHFGGNTNTKSRNLFLKRIWDLDYKICENELVALIEEAHAIKKYWPPLNRSLKAIQLNYGIYQYQDQNGYDRLAVGETGKHDKPIISFRYQYQARNFLADLVKNFNLCPKLSGLQEGVGECDKYFDTEFCSLACNKVESVKDYKERFNKALDKIVTQQSTYYLTEKTSDGENDSLVVFEKGKYLGYGIKPRKKNIKNIEEAKNLIQYGYDDQDIRGIIESYVKRKKGKVQITYFN